MKSITPYQWKLIAAGVVVALGTAGLLGEFVTTAPVRESLQTLSRLIAESNLQEPDVASVRALCSARYLSTHRLQPAAEGGFVGLPRSVSKNFRAWREQDKVWICPSNRDRNGPIYQFVLEDEVWKFDGPIGILTTRGVVMPMTEGEEPAEEP